MSSSKKSNGSLVDQLAFISVILLALVMVINAIVNLLAKIDIEIKNLGRITGALNTIAMAIAIGITVFCSYFAARRKSKNTFALWLVCAILVVLCFILGITIL